MRGAHGVERDEQQDLPPHHLERSRGYDLEDQHDDPAYAEHDGGHLVEAAPYLGTVFRHSATAYPPAMLSNAVA